MLGKALGIVIEILLLDVFSNFIVFIHPCPELLMALERLLVRKVILLHFCSSLVTISLLPSIIRLAEGQPALDIS